MIEPSPHLTTGQICILGWMVLTLSLQDTNSFSEPSTDTTQWVVRTALCMKHIRMSPRSKHNTSKAGDEGAGKMASCEHLGGPKVGTSQGCQTTCTAPEHVRLLTPAIISTVYCTLTLPFHWGMSKITHLGCIQLMVISNMWFCGVVAKSPSTERSKLQYYFLGCCWQAVDVTVYKTTVVKHQEIGCSWARTNFSPLFLK